MKWEHRVVVLNVYAPLDRSEVADKDILSQEECLDIYGVVGWELVSVILTYNRGPVAYFKRQVQEGNHDDHDRDGG